MSLVSHCQLKSLWSAHHLAAALICMSLAMYELQIVADTLSTNPAPLVAKSWDKFRFMLEIMDSSLAMGRVLELGHVRDPGHVPERGNELPEAATKSTASDGECGSANGRHATKCAGCAAGAADSLQPGIFQSCKFCDFATLRNSCAGRDCRNAVVYEHTESVSAEAFYIFSTLQGSQLIGLWFSSPVWLIYTDAISLWIGLLTSTLIQQQTAVVGYYFPFFTLPYFAKLVYN